jgi:hypothetical protein
MLDEINLAGRFSRITENWKPYIAGLDLEYRERRNQFTLRELEKV